MNVADCICEKKLYREKKGTRDAFGKNPTILRKLKPN